MVLCDAGPNGGSAYLAMGAGGNSLSPEDLSHQLAGLNAALPSAQVLICQRGQDWQGGAGSLYQDPLLSLGLNSVCAPSSEFSVCYCMWPNENVWQ